MKISRTGIPRLTADNVRDVVARLVEVADQLQGAVGAPEQRAVRLGELLRARIARVDPQGNLLLEDDAGGGGSGSGGDIEITGQPGRIVVQQGGQAFSLDLATVSPTAAGTLRAIVADTYGRIAGSRPVTAGPGIEFRDLGAAGIELSSTGTYDVAGTSAAAMTASRGVGFATDGRIEYLNRGVDTTAGRYLGILLTSVASAGVPVQVRRRGTISELGWAWTQGPVWLGDNGLLTQTIPSTGWLRQIGTAINSTTIDIDPEPPIL